MAKRNWKKDGPPKPGQRWACAARRNGMQPGVRIGCGEVSYGLVDEMLIDECIDALRDQGDNEFADLIEAAAADLPGFKRTMRKADAARFN